MNSKFSNCIRTIEFQYNNIYGGYSSVTGLVMISPNLEYINLATQTLPAISACTDPMKVNWNPPTKQVMHVQSHTLKYINVSYTYDIFNKDVTIEAVNMTQLDISNKRKSSFKSDNSCEYITLFLVPNLRHLHISKLDCSKYMPYNMLYNATKIESFYANDVNMDIGLRNNDPN
jgi:hypothetical protein